MQIGTIVGYPLAASIINFWGWEAVFYIQGVLTLVWCVAWFLIVTDKPEDFRWIKKAEIDYIKSSIGESKQSQKVWFKSLIFINLIAYFYVQIKIIDGLHAISA